MHPSELNTLYRRIGTIDVSGLCGKWLAHKERVLIRMVLDQGSTFEQIAGLTGESPSTVSRRFQRLLEKVINRRLLPVLKSRQAFDSRSVRIVQEYYLKGQPQKVIACKFNVSLYRIRTILQAARAAAGDGPETGPASAESRQSNTPRHYHKGAPSCTH